MRTKLIKLFFTSRAGFFWFIFFDCSKKMNIKFYFIKNIAIPITEITAPNISLNFTFSLKTKTEIVKRAIMNSIDIIIMTKSTKKGLTRMIGSVTSYVVRNAPCIVMIVPE